MSKGKIKVELNREAVRSLLKSEAMAALCRGYAEDIASRAGSGVEVTTHVGPNRVNASVHTTSEKSYKENMKNNTLLKSM